MISGTLSCSLSACHHKRYNLDRLSHEALTLQLGKCERCENGLFKLNLIAAKTHQIIALYWAQMHNALTGKAVGSMA